MHRCQALVLHGTSSRWLPDLIIIPFEVLCIFWTIVTESIINFTKTKVWVRASCFSYDISFFSRIFSSILIFLSQKLITTFQENSNQSKSLYPIFSRFSRKAKIDCLNSRENSYQEHRGFLTKLLLNSTGVQPSDGKSSNLPHTFHLPYSRKLPQSERRESCLFRGTTLICRPKFGQLETM